MSAGEGVEVVGAVEGDVAESSPLQEQGKLVSPDVAQDERGARAGQTAIGALAIVEEGRVDPLLGLIEHGTGELVDPLPRRRVVEGPGVDEAAVVLGQQIRVGREEIGDEEPPRAQAAKDRRQRGELIGLRLQMQEGVDRAEGEREMVVRQVAEDADVPLDQGDATIEALLVHRRLRHRQHRRGEVHPGHPVALGGQWQQHPPGAAPQFEDRVPGVRGERAIERQIVVEAAELQVVEGGEAIEVDSCQFHADSIAPIAATRLCRVPATTIIGGHARQVWALDRAMNGGSGGERRWRHGRAAGRRQRVARATVARS